MAKKQSAMVKKAIRGRKVKLARRKSAKKKRRAIARTPVGTKRRTTAPKILFTTGSE